MNHQHQRSGMVMTVLGPIPADQLGFTQPHEHLLIDLTLYFGEPPCFADRKIAHEPVSWESLRWIRYHLRHHRDNARLADEQVAVQELVPFRNAGGNTLVDQTPIGYGRDPRALARISRASGVQIVMGTGRYVASNDPVMENMTEDQMTEEIVRDVTRGADGTNIRSGLIGEIGCSWPMRPSEKRSLRAAARAQRETGLAVSIHPGRNEQSPLEAVDVLKEAGADLKRVVICHMDRCGYALETRLKILEAGCFVEYDLFGSEGWYPADAALSEGHLPNILNDVGRIREIADLIERGFLDRLLISHDICYQVQQARWSGPGYAHIIENVLPLMKVYGYEDSHLHALTVQNPKRMLTIQ